LISASDRKTAIELIDETIRAGAREKLACRELGISQRTLQRWREAETRKRVYELARARHPERWTCSTRDWRLDDEVWYNPERSTNEPESKEDIT